MKEEATLFKNVFEIIEEALAAKGYRILEGDDEIACVQSPNGIDFDIKLIMCEDEEEIELAKGGFYKPCRISH